VFELRMILFDCTSTLSSGVKGLYLYVADEDDIVLLN
jgi:hypothetical protein